MQPRHLRIALLSDLHAFHPAGSRTDVSYLPCSPQPSDPDPFGDLERLIAKECISVDLLLCAGDICDKADLRGFQYAWKRLHELQKVIDASHLIATCGNHDLNSRHIGSEDDPDPKGSLQTVKPQFPFESDTLTDHFWSRNFAILEPSKDVRILVLNSSAYHGGQDGEIEYGRISGRTINAIEKKIKEGERSAINILLCHHHVKQLKGLWGKSPDGEFMQKGSELISTLANSTSSPWLVLHGHRHTPNLEHSRDPDVVVMGASSFSGQVPGKLNQFHILDITADHNSQQPLKGKIETWTWTVTSGWQTMEPSEKDDGFPPLCGFGSNFQPIALAAKISELFQSGPDYKNWSEIVKEIPDIQFLSPAHLRQVENLLSEKEITILRNKGQIHQIGRAT